MAVREAHFSSDRLGADLGVPPRLTERETFGGARRPGGRPLPRPATEPVTAQRRVSANGVIMVAGQKIALGRNHAATVVTAHVAAGTITVDLNDSDVRTIRRTTTQPVRSIKAAQPRKAAHVS